LIRLRPHSKLINSKYLLYALSSTFMREQIEFKAKSTSGVNNINSDELKSLVLPLCPIHLQQAIVDILDNRMTVCDKIEETITQSLAQTETLKQSILKKAFEGRLV
jgi:type I restriction enzyme, S subunit